MHNFRNVYALLVFRCVNKKVPQEAGNAIFAQNVYVFTVNTRFFKYSQCNINMCTYNINYLFLSHTL